MMEELSIRDKLALIAVQPRQGVLDWWRYIHRPGARPAVQGEVEALLARAEAIGVDLPPAQL